jgi:DivIVA domain-containing protein
MNLDQNLMSVEFPRAVRGYSTASVDEFVKDMGNRLSALQEELNKREQACEKIQSELDETRKQLDDYKSKESAIANAMVALQQQRIAMESEMDNLRRNTEQEAEQVRSAARNEAASMLAEVERKAEEMILQAKAKCDEQEEKYRQLCDSFMITANRIRKTLEAQMALLPENNTELPEFGISAIASDVESITQAA